jgi:hypothetical protein
VHSDQTKPQSHDVVQDSYARFKDLTKEIPINFKVVNADIASGEDEALTAPISRAIFDPFGHERGEFWLEELINTLGGSAQDEGEDETVPRMVRDRTNLPSKSRDKEASASSSLPSRSLVSDVIERTS